MKPSATGRSALELAILGFLSGAALHGYELRKRLSQTLGPIGRLSFGTLYPALNRLEKAGAVEVLKVTESRTGLTTERGRKVYAITDTGRELFDAMLDQPAADDDKAFAMRVTFAKHLSREARLRLLMHRREQLVSRHAAMKQNLAGSLDGVDDYGRMWMEHTNEMTEKDIAWLNQMIANEEKVPARKGN